MKTTKKVIEESGIDPRLVRGVIRQLGDKESLTDIANHGMAGGFSGFTYHSDTVKFFKAYRKEITTLVENMAQDMGETPVDMVAGFNCLAGSSRKRTGTYNEVDREYEKAKRELYPSISRCLYGGRLTDDDTEVANALAWFAGEEVARAFEEDN